MGAPILYHVDEFIEYDEMKLTIESLRKPQIDPTYTLKPRSVQELLQRSQLERGLRGEAERAQQARRAGAFGGLGDDMDLGD